MANHSFTPRLRFDSDARGLVKLFRASVRRLRPRFFLLAMVALLLAPACPLSHAQSASPPDPMAPANPGAQPARSNSPLHPEEEQDPMVHRAQQRMVERRNEERQKSLVVDTDRLLNLAEELKTEVDKSSKDQLSVDVVKRAEQIEKLARSVKEKMRGY